jgi:uncharacterized protein YecT (DUF1311 family)
MKKYSGVGIILVTGLLYGASVAVATEPMSPATAPMYTFPSAPATVSAPAYPPVSEEKKNKGHYVMPDSVNIDWWGLVELPMSPAAAPIYTLPATPAAAPAAPPVSAHTLAPAVPPIPEYKKKRRYYTIMPDRVTNIDWQGPVYPYFPALRKGADEKVCLFILDGVRQVYKSSSPSLALLSRADRKGDVTERAKIDFKAEEVTWDNVVLPFDVKGSDILYKAELDIDGTGNRQVVVRRDYERSWRGPTYSLYVFKTEKLFYESIYASKTMDELVAKGTVIYDGSWKWNNVFEFNNKYYILDEGNEEVMETATSLVVQQIKSEGGAVDSCVVDYYHSASSLAGFDDSAELQVFFKTLSMMGSSDPNCGNIYSGTTHENGIRGVILRAKTRPWATKHSRAWENHVGNHAGYYVYDRFTEYFLQSSGDGDPWSRREYFTHLENEHEALTALAGYLVKAYKLDQVSAKEYAHHVIKNVVAAHFLIHQDYRHGAWDGSDDKAREAADKRYEFEFAVDEPKRIAALIKSGADVNGQNWFGKTALMYAAHLNQITAVKVLLEHGADVNLATTAGRQYTCGQFDRVGRTALMYAAENGSIPVMRMLLDAGADVNAKDSKGNNVDFYLQRIPRFSTDEKSPGFKRLVDNYKTSSKRIDSGINCNKALSRIEKAICGDEALKIYDHDLAIAYGAWLKNSKKPNLVKQQQRDWLSRRQQECDALKNEDSHKLCIQENTRARARHLWYLQEVFLHEKTKPN